MTDPTDPTSGKPDLGRAATPPGAAPSEDPAPANPHPEDASAGAADPPAATRPEVPQSPPAQRAAPAPLAAPPSDPSSATSSAETARLRAAGPSEERPKKRFRWSTKKTIAAAVVALALATGVSGVVYAVTSSDGDSDGHRERHGKPGRADRDPMSPGSLRAGMYGPLDALHGEFTVQGTDGNYVVKFTQVGVVTEIDSDSLTVKSADGYTKTYAIDADTAQRAIAERDDSGKVEEKPSIDKDETVAVTATVSGDQATADSILERGKNSGVTRPLPGGPDQLPLPRGYGRR